MAPKYPKFKSEFDTDALEVWMALVVKILARHLLDPRAADFLKGILYRTSPYYRDKAGENVGREILDAAHWRGWDGTEQ